MDPIWSDIGCVVDYVLMISEEDMHTNWESANWTRQFGIRQTGNRQFGMLAYIHVLLFF